MLDFANLSVLSNETIFALAGAAALTAALSGCLINTLQLGRVKKLFLERAAVSEEHDALASTFKHYQEVTDQIVAKLTSVQDGLSNRVDKLENQILEHQVTGPKGVPFLFNLREHILRLHQSGKSLESIVEELPVRRSEAELLIRVDQMVHAMT